MSIEIRGKSRPGDRCRKLAPFISASGARRWGTGIAVLALSLLACDAQATKLSLNNPPPPAFSWADFVPGTGAAGITVQEYRNTDGSAGGPIIVFNTHILDIDPDLAEPDPPVICFIARRCEDIGIATFQYALWRGTAAGGANVVGAAFLGGLNLTDRDDVGMNFSFLQIFTDNANPAGRIDGGGFRGKVNGDIPAYNANPADAAAGWNFAGNDVQFDYFDIPFDPATVAETVAFETALVCYNGRYAQILGDFTWSFTGNGTGGVTGMSVAEQPSASARLLNLYRTMFPGTNYANRGEGSCHTLAIPEPATPALLVMGLFAMLITGARLRKAR